MGNNQNGKFLITWASVEERRNKFVSHIVRKGEVEELSLSGKLLGAILHKMATNVC